MRLANIPLLLVALVFIWLLAGELVGRGPLQYLATAVAALVPQLMNVVATINPDILLVAEWSAALWLMTLVVRRGPRRKLVVSLAGLVVVGALTQPRSLPLVVPALMAVLLGWARERGWRRLNPLTLGVGALVIGVPLALVVAGRGQGSAREFGSYLWQFYLPKLSFMNTTIGPVSYDVRTGFVDRIFGTLAQLEVVLPPTIADIAWWVARLGLAALVVALLIRRDAVRRNAGLTAVFLTAIWTLLLSLHLVAYRSMVSSPGDPVITGRYLLPLIGLLGVAVAIVGKVLPRPARAAFTGLALAAGVAIQIVSLGLLLERFYA
jgi:4-amino-4-deoxy-L-arabinose transferase-like glycosyltransferase